MALEITRRAYCNKTIAKVALFVIALCGSISCTAPSRNAGVGRGILPCSQGFLHGSLRQRQNVRDGVASLSLDHILLEK